MFVSYTPRKKIRAPSSSSDGKVPDCPYSLTAAFSMTFAQAQVATYLSAAQVSYSSHWMLRMETKACFFSQKEGLMQTYSFQNVFFRALNTTKFL